MNIVVLAGGLSTERDVSLITGKMVTQALRTKKNKVILLDVYLGIGKDGDDLTDAFNNSEKMSISADGIKEKAPDLAVVKNMRKENQECFFGPNVIRLCQMSDIVFMALHGSNGEDGKIQAAFDLFGIKYTGTGYLSSALAMDKSISKQFFRINNIPTPNGVSVKKKCSDKSFTATNLTYPCVVKPCQGGSSIGVSIVNNDEEYGRALKEAFELEEEVIVEQYIRGREFSVGVIENKALPIIEIAPIEGFYDYKNKYKAGSAVETCPADLAKELTEKMQKYAVMVCKALGLSTYSRMDFLLDENENIYCLEANTLPGMTPTSLLPQEALAIGISFENLCEKLINISLS